MPWGIVAGAAIGAIGSSMAADKAADSASEATAAQSQSAAASTALGREQLQFAKDQYAEGKPYREAAEGRATKISDALLAQQAQQAALAQDYADYNKNTFRPLEERIVSEAQAYDTPDRRAAAMAGAHADVEQAFGSAQDATSRAIARTGGSVSSGRSVAMMQDAALAKAKADAGATTMASRNVEQQGYARMADAANLGRNLPSAQATAASTAVQAGSASSTSAQQALAAQQSGMGSVMQGYSGAVQSTLGAGQLYGNVASQANAAANQEASAWSSLGSTVGRGISTYLNRPATTTPAYDPNDIMITSDKKVKKGTGKAANDDQALAEIEALPVEDGWQYDPAKGGPDDGGVRHTGPMAQSVRRTMGEALAPGGKQIDLVSMNGKVLAGMQALAKRMDRVEKRVAA